MTMMHATEIKRGDVLLADGRRHRIVRVDLRLGWAWPIAVDGTGWAIALGDQPIEVERAESSGRRPRSITVGRCSPRGRPSARDVG